MLNAAIPSTNAAVPTVQAQVGIGRDCTGQQSTADTLKLLCEQLRPQRRVVHAGDTIYQAGERFGNLYILNSGFAKIVNLSPDGREQVVGLKFRGDWLGFDGIATTQYVCDAVAMDTGEDTQGHWVETWTFAMTLKDPDHLLVHWTRVVNNTELARDAKGATFSILGIGELAREGR